MGGVWSEIEELEGIGKKVVEFLRGTLAIALNELRGAGRTDVGGAPPGTPIAGLVFSLRARDVGAVLKFGIQVADVFPTGDAHRAHGINMHFPAAGMCAQNFIAIL